MSHLVGISWFLAHIIVSVAANILLRYLVEDHHVFQVIFVSHIFAWMCVLLVIQKPRLPSLKTTRAKAHMLRAVMGTISYTCWMFALTKIALADAASLAQITPLLTTLFAVIILHESLGKRRLAALFLGFVGAFIILRPGTIEFNWWALLVVAATIIRAANDIVSKHLLRTDSGITSTFYLAFFSSFFMAPLGLLYWTPINWETFGLLLVQGVLGFAILYTMYKAFEHEQLTVLAPFGFLGLFLMFVAGYYLFDEPFDVYTMVGGVIILSSSIYIIYRQHKRMREMQLLEQVTDAGEL